MKWAFAVACVATASADEGENSPIAKVISMITNLQAKIIKEGEEIQKTYDEFHNWCEDKNRQLQNQIKSAKGEVRNLKASIEKETASIQVDTSTIEEVAADIAGAEADLAKAKKLRSKETQDFQAFEADISETIDTVERAIGVIEKHRNGGESMMQFQHSGSVLQALGTLVSAEAISSSDGKRLTALVQSNSDDEQDPGAPAAAAYEMHQDIPNINDILNGLLDKANSELEGARATEKSSLQKFEMLKMSLEDQIKFANKELDQAKKSRAESEEYKSTAEGDLGVTTGDLNDDVSVLADVHHDCMSRASEFEVNVVARGEELKALAEAKKIVIEATSLAQTSFLQLSTRSDHVTFEAVRHVRALAKKMHSTALAQLASRMDSTIRFGGKNKMDIFEEIKKDIEDRIAKIKAEDAADLTEKAFCDKEVPEAEAKVDDKADEIEKITAKIDKMTSKSTILGTEVAALQTQLTELMSSQAAATKIRQEEKADFEANKPGLEKAIAGIQKALQVLNEYYSKSADAAHGSSGGASSGIIGLLEVAESDFSKELAEITDAEQKAAYFFENLLKENEITKLEKEQDVKYKIKAAAGLDKSVSEYTSDRESVNQESEAVTSELRELKSRCTVMPANFEERTSARKEEMANLRDTLEKLEAQTADGQTVEGETAVAEEAEAAEGQTAEAQAAEAQAAEAGQKLEAEGQELKAEGEELKAEGEQLEAEGQPAEGQKAEAEGQKLEAEGQKLEAEGQKLEATAQTTGEGKTAEGQELEAEGKELEEEGQELEAEGHKLEAQGQQLEAEGQAAEGQKLEAEGQKLEAEGQKLEAEGQQLEAEGQKVEAEGGQTALIQTRSNHFMSVHRH